ncbi:MAG: IPT/TIG domain-containing protein [Blastocatellia bacterium]
MMKQRQQTMLHAITALIFLLLPIVAAQPVAAQQGGTTRYIYDQNGRLRAVISPSGEAGIYDYDPAGNFTAIRRLGANDCEALEFTPRQGPFGTQVTIYGVGFKGQVSGVTFNGAAAQIVRQTLASVVVKAPDGATTGPITVALPCGAKTFSMPFTVSGVRVLPSVIALAPSRTIQFTADVAGIADPAVKWGVNDVEGGNQSFGTITETGFYTAPLLPSSSGSRQFLVRATSVAEPSIFGEATVKVTDNGYEFLARGVSVRYGTVANNAIAYVATPLSVRYGNPPSNASAYVANSVSVRFGTPAPPVPAYVTGAVSVRYGAPTIQSQSKSSPEKERK